MTKDALSCQAAWISQIISCRMSPCPSRANHKPTKHWHAILIRLYARDSIAEAPVKPTTVFANSAALKTNTKKLIKRADGCLPITVAQATAASRSIHIASASNMRITIDDLLNQRPAQIIKEESIT